MPIRQNPFELQRNEGNPKMNNKIIYSVILLMTCAFMGCLDSDNLNDIVSQIPEEEPETLPIGEGLAIGATAPAFSLSDADEKSHELSDYAGQKVVLVFFATEG